MILPPFELHRPKTVEQAVALKARYGRDADFVLGGTDLLCNYKYELNAKPHVVSLRDVTCSALARCNVARNCRGAAILSPAMNGHVCTSPG